MKRKKTRTKITQLIILFFLFLSLGVVVKAVSYVQSLIGRASTEPAYIFIRPENGVLDPTGTVELWLSTNQPVAFSHVELTFDPSLIHMTQAITPTSLTRIVKQSTPTEANANGRIVLAQALDPSQLTSPPSGSFKLATIALAAATDATDLTTTLNIPVISVQIVSLNESTLSPTTTGSTLIINPAPSPTSTPIPTPSPTPTPTPLPNDPVPFFATWQLPKARMGRLYTATMTVADKNIADILNLTVTDLPVGFRLTDCRSRIDNRNHQVELKCTITGNPAAAGSYNPTFRVTDKFGQSKTKTYNLTIRQ